MYDYDLYIKLMTVCSVTNTIITIISQILACFAALPLLTESTVLNLVISPKQRVARFLLNLLQYYDLRKIQVTQREELKEPRYSTGSMSLHTPNHTFRACGGPETFNSITGRLHPERPLETPLPLLPMTIVNNYLTNMSHFN